MGEEMEFPAAKMMDDGMLTGKWVSSKLPFEY